MNPADSQDVPRAIDFLEAVEEIGHLPNDSCDPGEVQEAHLITAVGEIFTLFMDTFIRPDWSLTSQLTSLSKFAHASFALFRKEGVNFMPNQLYGDMQVTVKNAYFCVAKQQHIDGVQPFHLFWLGDDHLETLFGRVRMQGGHNPNFTLKQLVDRLAAAMDLESIFARHPNLDLGFRRLKVSRTEHLDHLNPKLWQGCTTANSISLESAWQAGREEATKLLNRINITFDFNSYFSSSTKHDLFCRRPDGSYPSVALDSEDGSLELEHLSSARPQASSVTLQPPSYQESPAHAPPAIHFGSLPSPLLHVKPMDLQYSDSTDLDRDLHSPTIEETIPEAVGIDLEDATDEPNGHALPCSQNITGTVDHWLEYGGKKIHKASIC